MWEFLALTAMNRIILIVLFSGAGWLTVNAQQKQADLTVFGFKLGAPFTVQECPCKIVVTQAGGNNSNKPFSQFAKDKGYQYTDFAPATGYCFQRINLAQYTVRRKDKLDSLQPIKNETVNVVFSPGETPAMCTLGRFSAIVKDGKLTAIAFSIRSADANKDFELLKNKYGTNAQVQNYKLQNGYGATMDYYEATWSFPNLWVDLLSSEHHSLNDFFGMITISQALPEQKQVDKRPL
jgi:hypothetical protein